MGQVAFDTLKFVKKLELAGVPAKQAEAFSEAVRESHEAVDVATKRDLEDAKKEVLSQVTAVKRDLEDVRKDLSAEIANVRKEMDARFDKVDARFEKAEAKTEAQIALLRKDMEFLTSKLLINITKIILGCVGLASAIVTLVVKFL